MNFEFIITDYKLRVTSYQFPQINFPFWILAFLWIYQLRITSYRLPVTSYINIPCKCMWESKSKLPAPTLYHNSALKNDRSCTLKDNKGLSHRDDFASTPLLRMNFGFGDSFGIWILDLPITDYKLQITRYRLPVTDYQLLLTNYYLPITNYRLQITNYKLPVPTSKLPCYHSPVTKASPC